MSYPSPAVTKQECSIINPGRRVSSQDEASDTAAGRAVGGSLQALKGEMPWSRMHANLRVAGLDAAAWRQAECPEWNARESWKMEDGRTTELQLQLQLQYSTVQYSLNASTKPESAM